MVADFDADEALAQTLAAALRVMAGRLRRKLREHGTLGDLTPSQVSVLAQLERNRMTVSALARAEGVRPQSMRVTVAALIAAGMLEGDPDPHDGRQTILDLTEPCRARIAAARASREDWLQRTIRSVLTPTEQGNLARGIALIERIIDA